MTDQQTEREQTASQRIPALEKRLAELETAKRRLEAENKELALQLFRERQKPKEKRSAKK
jgi:hypothetical protein